MDPKRYQKIKKIVIEAMEAPPNELHDLLNKLCGSDQELRQEVEELIRLDVGNTFLANCPVEIGVSDFQAERLYGKIGRISIDKLIARGGMGDVYTGTDELLDRPVAIKIMSKGLRLSAARRTAFLNEAKILSNLQHVNICHVYDFIEDQNQDVLIMELIEGQTLRQQLKKATIHDHLDLAIQLADALMAAHERGIGHHDLKPENIMVTEANVIKVLDFGLARSDQVKYQSHDAISGTPAYMSPEQALGEPLTTASDIWPLGLILIELWTGKNPQNNHETTAELIQNARLGKVSIPSHLSHAKTQLLKQMLLVDVAKRISARQVREQLEAIIEQPKKRFRMLIGFIIAILGLFSIWKYTTDLEFERALAVKAKDQAVEARNDAEDLIAFMLTDLQEGLQSVGKIALLESVANQVMAYYGELDSSVMRSTYGQPAVALTKVGEVFDLQGRKTDAIDVLNQAVNALSDLYKEFPENELIAFRLGSALTSLGENYKLDGQFEMAKTELQKAIGIGEALTSGHKPGQGPTDHPNGYERWKLVLKSQYLYADVYMRMGEGQHAVDILEAVVIPARKAADFEPRLMQNLADIEFKRCDTYYDIPIPDLMLEPCLSILEMDRLLHEAAPENYHLHSNYALDFLAVSRVYQSFKEFDLGLENAETSLKHMEQLVAWDPDNASRQNDLVLTIVNKARVLHLMNLVED
ncbi:MAG: serine/threonine-protein kinase, partial [Marinicella sp.]